MHVKEHLNRFFFFLVTFSIDLIIDHLQNVYHKRNKRMIENKLQLNEDTREAVFVAC